MRLFLFLIIFNLLAATPEPVAFYQGQPRWVWKNTFTGSQYMGRALQISENGLFAVVGDSPYNSGDGVVRVYNRSGDTWSHVVTISGNPGFTELIGTDVAITNAGEYILYAKSANQAQVYLKGAGNTWNYQTTLNMTECTNNGYGTKDVTVSISGDGSTAVIGCMVSPGGGSQRGVVYVWKRVTTTWSLIQTISNPNAVDTQWFGSSVKISNDGTKLFIGSTKETSGAIRYYTRSGDTFTAQYTYNSPSPVASGKFGSIICLSKDGTYLGVTAPGESSGSGGAHFYYYSTSAASYLSLNPSSTLLGGGTGCAISNLPKYLVAGQNSYNTVASAGSVQVWTTPDTRLYYVSSLIDPTISTNGYFGTNVSISEDGLWMIIGSSGGQEIMFFKKE
jgi:hypothetical protein